MTMTDTPDRARVGLAFQASRKFAPSFRKTLSARDDIAMIDVLPRNVGRDCVAMIAWPSRSDAQGIVRLQQLFNQIEKRAVGTGFKVIPAIPAAAPAQPALHKAVLGLFIGQRRHI